MGDLPRSTKPDFRFELLDKRKHDRAAFSCEHESLERYLKEQATQEIKKRVSAVYVLTPDGRTIAGYYTLSQYLVEAQEFPPRLLQELHLPRYDRLPATLLGRLARSKEFKGAGLGEILLVGALKRALEHSRNIASVAVVVDAIDERASAFYKHYSFVEFPNHPNRLFISMKTIMQLLVNTETE